MAVIHGKKLSLSTRIADAWNILRGGDYTQPSRSSSLGNLSVELNVDTTGFEKAMDRVKVKLAEYEAMTKLPAPRLMLKPTRPLSPDAYRQLNDSFQLSVESGMSFVVAEGMSVYQLIAGQWQPVDSVLPITAAKTVSLAEVVADLYTPPDQDAALLETVTQTVDEASAEWNIPTDRLRAD